MLKTRLQSQRDARWGSIMLGYNTVLPYNLYNYGCLITSLANYIDKQPDEVNQILKDNSGFQNGGLFVWSKSTVLGLTQTYLSSRCQTVSLYTTELDKLIGYLGMGFPALCEVDFNPATDGEEMHYVLAVGFTDGEIVVVDPWEGQIENWSFDAFRRNTYQFRIYDKKLEENGGVTIPVETKVFENLVRKSTIYDKVCMKLNKEDSETVILGELDRLIGYEDKVREQEKQLAEVRLQATKYESELKLSKDQLQQLEKKVSDLLKEVQGATQDNLTLSKAVQDLKTQAEIQSKKSWWELLLDSIFKGR